MSLSLLLNGIGVLLLLHAAYSCLHFRNLVADLELSNDETAHSSPRCRTRVSNWISPLAIESNVHVHPEFGPHCRHVVPNDNDDCSWHRRTRREILTFTPIEQVP